MATSIPNMFANQQSPLGAAFANLSRVLASGPSDAERYKQADEAVLTRRKVTGQESLADQIRGMSLIGRPQPAPSTPAMPAQANPGTLAGDVGSAVSPITQAFRSTASEMEGPSMAAPQMAPQQSPFPRTPAGTELYFDPAEMAASALYAGVDPGTLGGYQLNVMGNQFGARDDRVTNATVGAGNAYGSTAQSFDINQDNTMTRNREDNSAADTRTRLTIDATNERNAADNAAADRRAAAGRGTQLEIARMTDDRADRRAQLAQDKIDKKEKLTNDLRASTADIVLGKVDEALDKSGFMTTGTVGGILRNVPGTGAYTLDRTVDTIKANLGFDALAAMRAASPTGGALGQVAVKELDMLQAGVASLDTGLPQSQLVENLDQVGHHYQNVKRIMSGKPPLPRQKRAPAAIDTGAPVDSGVDDLLKQYGQ